MEMANNLYKYIVYCTTCLCNNKIYIGVHKTKDPDKFDGYLGCGVRISMPKTYIHERTIFQRAVHKYGVKNFKRSIIKVFDNEEDAYALEADIVNEEFLARNDVYNMCPGGRGGDRGAQSTPCYQYDLDGNFIAEYKTRKEAADVLKKGTTTISRAIHDKIKAVNSFWSDIKTEKLDLTNYHTDTNRKQIYQYSETGEYDCCYESTTDASRVLNISVYQIREAAVCGYLCGNKFFSYIYSDQFSSAKFDYLHQIPVYVYNLDGTFFKEYSNLFECQKQLKLKQDVCKYAALNSIFGDYQFSFDKIERMPDKTIKKPCKRRIAQYDENGNQTAIFECVADAVKIYGTGVKHCLTGRNKFSKGFAYKYL